MRKNGTRGGRPRKSGLLSAKVRRVHAELQPQLPGMDPGDLLHILERLFRPAGSSRQFFIWPKAGGGFVF